MPGEQETDRSCCDSTPLPDGEFCFKQALIVQQTRGYSVTSQEITSFVFHKDVAVWIDNRFWIVDSRYSTQECSGQ